MDKLSIRKARVEDVDRILELIRESQKIMNQQNNFQWSDTYPGRENILRDIKHEGSFILELNGEMIGSLTMLEPKFAGGDMVYEYEGRRIWMTDDDENYMFVGRSALSPRVRNQGFAATFLEEIFRICRQKGKTSIRGLTDKNNIPIIKLFAKFGFENLGEVYNPTFNRTYVALEKILHPQPNLWPKL